MTEAHRHPVPMKAGFFASCRSRLLGSLCLAGLLAAVPVSESRGQGFSVSPWIGDASLGISADTVWAYSFGSAAGTTVEGVPVTGIAGANPSVAGRFSVTIPNLFPGDTNDLTALTGTGSAVVAANFLWGGNPSTITLQGLVPGDDYVLSIPSVGWDPTGTRLNHFTSGTHALIVDQNAYGNDKGLRVDYAFTADMTTRVVTIAPQTSDTWHIYGLSLRRIKAPIVVTNLNDSGAGSLREALQTAQASAGDDLILFDAGLSGQTISLLSELTTADVDELVVDATGLPDGLTLQGAGNHRGISNSGVLTLRGLTLTGMVATAGGNGGAILSSGTLVLEQCSLEGNSAEGSGGALYNSGNASLNRCTISGNTAAYGGALTNGGFATITLVQSTVAANNGGFWTIHNDRGYMTLRHCTVAANVPSGADAVLRNSQTSSFGGPNYSATLTLENCIIAKGNNGNSDINAPDGLIWKGANLVEKHPSIFLPSAPLVTVAPALLGPLADNGGPTRTMRLLAGSPAIDAAVDSIETIDQRGEPRPVDGDNSGLATADLGAFERAISLSEIEVFAGAGTDPADELTDDAGVQVFPATSTAGTTVRTFTIRNTGTESLLDLELRVPGLMPGEFLVSPLSASTLAPGSTMTFDVTFAPLGPGNPSATIFLVSNDHDESPFEIHVSGTANAAQIDVRTGTPAPGAVITWGGFLGPVPVPAAAQRNVTAIATGTYHVVALKHDGRVIVWGEGTDGQANVPSEAESGVAAIEAGDYFTMALKNGGVLTWGSFDGMDPAPPVPVEAQSGVSAISAGSYHAAALKSDGSVIAWGSADVYDDYGQADVPPEAQSGVIAISAGTFHTVALKSDGSVIAWGAADPIRDYGQADVPPEAQSGVVAIAAGAYHTLALKSDGRVIAWGASGGTAVVPHEATFGVTSIAAGIAHSLALKSDGSVIAWGYDETGQATVPAEALSGVTAVAAGLFNSLALRAYSFTSHVGGSSPPKVVTILNQGNLPLLLDEVVLQGANPGEFLLDTTSMTTSIPPGGQTSFTLTFVPQETGSSSTREVDVRITSNDPRQGTYEITLEGFALSATLDTDTDGMTDADEFRLRAFGLDWELSQPELTAVYDRGFTEAQEDILTDPNANGLYTPEQITAQNAGTPLIRRNGPGRFALTLGIGKSTTLLPASFAPFPFDAAGTTVNGEGKVEFLFNSPEDAAFYRLEIPGEDVPPPSP